MHPRNQPRRIGTIIMRFHLQGLPLVFRRRRVRRGITSIIILLGNDLQNVFSSHLSTLPLVSFFIVWIVYGFRTFSLAVFGMDPFVSGIWGGGTIRVLS